MICAEERLTPISGPKSIVSFQAGLRASGNSSTRDHAADAHVDRLELLEVDQVAASPPARVGRRRRGRCARGRSPRSARRRRGRSASCGRRRRRSKSGRAAGGVVRSAGAWSPSAESCRSAVVVVGGVVTGRASWSDRRGRPVLGSVARSASPGSLDGLGGRRCVVGSVVVVGRGRAASPAACRSARARSDRWVGVGGRRARGS